MSTPASTLRDAKSDENEGEAHLKSIFLADKIVAFKNGPLSVVFRDVQIRDDAIIRACGPAPHNNKDTRYFNQDFSPMKVKLIRLDACVKKMRAC